MIVYQIIRSVYCKSGKVKLINCYFIIVIYFCLLEINRSLFHFQLHNIFVKLTDLSDIYNHPLITQWLHSEMWNSIRFVDPIFYSDINIYVPNPKYQWVTFHFDEKNSCVNTPKTNKIALLLMVIQNFL